MEKAAKDKSNEAVSSQTEQIPSSKEMGLERLPTKSSRDLQTIASDKNEIDQLQKTDILLDQIMIFCGICKDYISHSVTTYCEHTFCQACLNEYLLFLDECPECKMRIRNQKLINNILFDNLVIDYIQRYDPEDMEEYKQRIQREKQLMKEREVGDLQTGAEVDIRDSEYVWCVGKVQRVLNKFKVKYVVVKYNKSQKKEQLPEASTRLAKAGFYTSRVDIPKYQQRKLVVKDALGQTYLIPTQEELTQ